VTETLLKVIGLTKHFLVTRGIILKKVIAEIHAVDDVSFDIIKGQTLGLIGESGSGKTTIANLIVGLLKPTKGQIIFEGRDLANSSRSEFKKVRSKIGLIFQDPFSSLDPRKKVAQIIEEPMKIHQQYSKAERFERVCKLLEKVGLSSEDNEKYPHQFSGGQRQRIAIARALALSPHLIIADEPTSALDVSVQARIINVLIDLQEEFKLTYLFISHDLSLIQHISDIVAVMYLGKIVELASVSEIYKNPLHPYTRALMESIPRPDPDLMRKNPPVLLQGEIPSPLQPPLGCRFHTRCIHAKELCSRSEPQFQNVGSNHFVSCHFWREIEEKHTGILQER